jgi:hypothetical protein
MVDIAWRDDSEGRRGARLAASARLNDASLIV